MPIYEEKLICPLAVRFTQEHIRPEFQEGGDLEATIKEIKTKPGIGPYDVVLEAPFPAIEIIRWYPKDGNSDDVSKEHWCTLDNRRLYCLQRVAAALWPQRTAIIVEALYAATDGIRKKNNSTTGGRTVAIGHSLKAVATRWDWYEAVPAPAGGGEDKVRAAQKLLAVDESKTFKDLIDAPAPPSMLDLYAASQSAKQTSAQVVSDAGSTADTSTPRSSPSSISPRCTPPVVSSPSGGFSFNSFSELFRQGVEETRDARQQLTEPPRLSMVMEKFIGFYKNDKGETYKIERSDERAWICLWVDSSGRTSKVETLWYDERSDTICWGPSWSMWMNAADLLNTSGQLHWLSGGWGGYKQQTKLTWHKISQQWAAGSVAAPRLDKCSKECATRGKPTRGASNAVKSYAK